MRDLTLSQEYLLCAVNEKGRLPHLGVERTVCLVAAALLELQLEGCVAVDKKYVTVTGPLPEGQAHLRPLCVCQPSKADPKGEAAGGVHLYCHRCSAR